MKNNLTTTQKTDVVLAKGKSLLGITAKILAGSKALATSKTYKDITIIGDLMWEKESRELNWYEAMEYAENLKLSGYNDWRLPTLEELGEVVALCGGINAEYVLYGDWDEITDKNEANEVYQSSYKEKGFVSYDYWSSTTHAIYIDSAWITHFSNGLQSSYFKPRSNYVRCVRVGQ